MTDLCILCKMVALFGNGFMITVTNIETLSDH